MIHDGRTAERTDRGRATMTMRQTTDDDDDGTDGRMATTQRTTGRTDRGRR